MDFLRQLTTPNGLFFLLFFSLHDLCFSQAVNLGVPPVSNFSKEDYKSGTQTWDISQDERGITWFANNGGLLEFDGAHWRSYPLPNATIVRAVRAGTDGRVFVGGQNEFGYFAPDQQGRMQYHSLLPLLPPNERNPGEIWEVEVLPSGVFFRADYQMFRFHAEKITPLFSSKIRLAFMGKAGERLLVQDGDTHQFLIFENDQFRPFGTGAAFRAGLISGVLQWDSDTLLVVTIQNGIFKFDGSTYQAWQTADDDFLKKNRVFCASQLPDGKIALGTIFGGLATLDRQRRIFQQLDKKSGLQNSTVLSLLPTASGSVWLGLDNGIDFVQLDAPFSTIYPDGDLQGTGYAAQIFNEKIYFGTNTGLFAADWKKYYSPAERQRFVRVQNTDGQVWSLNREGDALLMGHHEGAFEIEGLTARPLTRLQGIWKFLEIAPDRAVAGHYHGFASFQKKVDGGWQFDSALPNFSESSRLLALASGGKIWMAHPYRGIFRASMGLDSRSLNIEFFGEKNGLPSDVGNHLFQLGERVVFTNSKGVFNFDETQNRFLPDEQFARIFGKNTPILFLFQSKNGDIWYETDRESGVLLVNDEGLEKKIRRLPVPELRGKLVTEFQFVYPVDKQNIFVATTQGFLLFDLEKYLRQSADPLRLVLSSVRLKSENDSLLFGGHRAALATEIRLAPTQNSLAFSFAVPDRRDIQQVQFSYFLEGIGERKWSDWSKEAEVSISHLRPGRYIFRVKARNQHGLESAEQQFSFTILPPWYASRTAYFFYFLATAGVLAWLFFRQKRHFELEKQNLHDLHRRREAQHEENFRQSEEVILQLKQEKLETEIAHKTGELASLAMHLAQKNSLIQSVREALGKLKYRAEGLPEVNREIGQIVRIIENDANLDADWEHFSQNFDRVHHDFLRRLGEQYPHLSPNDFKLCAYLRMNLSSKEIASLLSIGIRGVEAGRYRLRKRMGLDTEVNLTDFLMRF